MCTLYTSLTTAMNSVASAESNRTSRRQEDIYTLVAIVYAHARWLFHLSPPAEYKPIVK
jgi:hypothetical protein